LGGLFCPQVRGAASPADEHEFFEKDVRPLLVEKCWQCHGDGKIKGGLRLTSRASVLEGGDSGPAAVSGKPAESLLIRAVRYDADLRMPPKGKLTARQVDVLARWVERGLPWPEDRKTVSQPERAQRLAISDEQRRFWAFQPVVTVAPPDVRDAAWVRSPVDRYILSPLEKKGLTPAAPADRRTLLRRVTLDLIGLPATPDEVDAFVADDSPAAFDRVVDRLLASPRYGERWGRHWLDVVRYADARDLIQLPAESDFREAWRYRDWVVDAFNRDLPYPDFVRAQVAGDLLPPPRPGGINAEGLVATGMLAIADFVPGDVDKEQMIADYVNDQVDVVSRAFLGLSIACARCHDHKFDPISTEDYYALAGIFFSTRLIPEPSPGNTPLVRVPLLSPSEIAAIEARDARDKRRRAELEQQLPDAADREYIAHLTRRLTKETERYLIAACRVRADAAKASRNEVAKREGLREDLLTGWVRYLERVNAQPLASRPAALRAAAAGTLSGPALVRSARELQQGLAAVAMSEKATRSPNAQVLAEACVLRFRADDPQVGTDAKGRVSLWPNRAGLPSDAIPPSGGYGPTRASATIAGLAKPVLRFDGTAMLEAPRCVAPSGSLFAVFRSGEGAVAGQRLLGWEDSDVGKHGLSLMPNPDGRLQAILRNNGRSGDLVVACNPAQFEVVAVTWGPSGTQLYRNGAPAGASKEIDAVSADPAIAAFRLGGPGSGSSARFRGDLAEIRVYNRPLADTERRQVEAELQASWFQPADPRAAAPDSLAELFDELRSPRGPFWVSSADRRTMLSPDDRVRLAALDRELDALRRKTPTEIPRAVAVQDGGPKGSRHEGFKDAQVYVRGDPKKPGKTVPRGFPRVLAGETQPSIHDGSGRRQLADWLARTDHPLTARVMVNRIWQHHFGEGLVRTPNDFGTRGERPTHPELLDDLAARFVASGWSIKAMHRLILKSSTYQQTTQTTQAPPEGRGGDPENRLFGRMNRRRLEAEEIRDSLLTVAGQLEPNRGGPGFTDPGVPKRTLYLMSVRTGPNTSDFGRLFDRADPGSIVAQRGQSIVAPQALFFLNDPFVADLAKALATRIAREEPWSVDARIRRLYALTLSRPPTTAETDLGRRLLTPDGSVDPWERYCHLILCKNEFLYVD
jgi:hypothetical protein